MLFRTNYGKKIIGKNSKMPDVPLAIAELIETMLKGGKDHHHMFLDKVKCSACKEDRHKILFVDLRVIADLGSMMAFNPSHERNYNKNCHSCNNPERKSKKNSEDDEEYSPDKENNENNEDKKNNASDECTSSDDGSSDELENDPDNESFITSDSESESDENEEVVIRDKIVVDSDEFSSNIAKRTRNSNKRSKSGRRSDRVVDSDDDDFDSDIAKHSKKRNMKHISKKSDGKLDHKDKRRCITSTEQELSNRECKNLFMGLKLDVTKSLDEQMETLSPDDKKNLHLISDNSDVSNMDIEEWFKEYKLCDKFFRDA